MLGVGQCPPSVPSNTNLSREELAPWQLVSLKGSKCMRTTECKRGCPREKPQSFCNLISEVTANHFCFILFIRGKSIYLLHSRKGKYPEYKYQEMRVIGSHLGGSCLYPCSKKMSSCSTPQILSEI